MRYLILLFLLFTATAIHAEQVISLKDGSQVKGTLVGIKDGVYTIKTPSMGQVAVAVSDVITISNGAVTTGTSMPVNTPTAPVNPDLVKAQALLTSNPEAMMDIQSLAQDPEILQMLSDPELVKAVTSHDVNAVRNNPRAQALMNNPKMRAIIEKLQSHSISNQQ